MSNAIENIVSLKRPGTNKRQWTYEEESKLIEALLELNAEGRFKAGRGFKSEYFKAVEDLLQRKLPGHGIKAIPHIKSKLRTLRTHISIVHDMLVGTNCSGFGWNSERKCVMAKQPVWEEYLKSHQDAEQFRFKSFPFYEELCIASRKYYASGKDVETPADVVEELKREATINANENVTIEDRDNNVSIFATIEEGGSKLNNNRIENISTLSKVIRESATIICNVIGKATDRLSRALEDAKATEKRSMINGTLTKLLGLRMFERHKAARKIGYDRELIDIFFTILDEEKEAFVKALLNGDI